MVGLLDGQQGNIIETISALNRLAGTFAGQRPVLTAALNRIPAALEGPQCPAAAHRPR